MRATRKVWPIIETLSPAPGTRVGYYPRVPCLPLAVIPCHSGANSEAIPIGLGSACGVVLCGNTLNGQPLESENPMHSRVSNSESIRR